MKDYPNLTILIDENPTTARDWIDLRREAKKALEEITRLRERIDVPEKKLEELRHSVIVWANASAQSFHKLAVELASDVNICRICFCSPPQVPTTLGYGDEYACEEC